MTDPMVAPRERIDRSAAILGAATVVAANLVYLAGLPALINPVLATDPLYIEMAEHPIAKILAGDPAWGPLYALWLKPFVAMLGDPLAVYTANVCALSIGVSLLLFCYVLLLTRRATWGVGVACVFLITDLNVPLAGKVGNFALLVVLAGLTASELVRARSARFTAVGAGALLASYARPELYPAAVCLAAAAAWRGWSEARQSTWRPLLWPCGLLIVLLIAAAWIGPPAFGPAPEGDRLLAAFQEHFAWNWSRWHDHPAYFLDVWKQEFGPASSVAQAVLANPAAVAHHLGQNLLGTAGFLIGSAFDHYPVLAPATSQTATRAESLLAAAAVFGMLLAAAVRRNWRRQFIARYGHLFLPYAILAIVPISSAIVIFPLTRYLIVPAVLLLLMAAAAAAVMLPAPEVRSPAGRLFIALACLAAIPRPFVLPSAYVVADTPFKGRLSVTRPVVETISLIRSLGLPPPVQVLTFTDGIGELLGPGFHEVKVWQKGEQSLEEYIRSQQISVIVTLEPGTDSFRVKDPYWTLIQTNPQATGFLRLPIPGEDAVRVYVRSSLPQPGSASAHATEPVQ